MFSDGTTGDEQSTMSLVSAIIPTKDRASRLDGAIRSVGQQTYDDIEIIVVDDGSSDSTSETVDRLNSKIGQPITYLRNEQSQGPAAARNQGAEAANGEYLAFLDDDDRWAPQKTALQLQQIENAPETVAVVYCGFVILGENNQVIRKVTPTAGDSGYEALLVSNTVGHLQTMLIRRDAFEHTGGLDESFALAEDWEFTIRLAREYDFVPVQTPLVIYKRHDNQISGDVDSLKKSNERVLSRYDNELKKKGLKKTAWAEHHRYIGTKYCKQGELMQGRDELRASLAVRPNLTAGLVYLLTYLGEQGFDIGVSINRTLEKRTSTF